MKRTTLLPAVVAALALLGAGCGSDDEAPASAGAPTTSTSAGEDETTSSTAAATTTTAAGEEGPAGASDTEAAEIRADLAALLDEHVYLTATTATRLVGEGASSPAAAASAAALDANSIALSEVVSTGYDPEVGEDFLRIWRGHVTAYVDYTSARLSGNAGGAAAATEVLDAFRSETGELFEQASDEALSAAEVEDGLDTHVQSTLAALDATVAGSPDAIGLVREAASHAPDSAAVWARGMTVEEDG
jgi:hypothetical protein